ncbi:MAG TPA: UDP-glucose 4-epimerase GalE [Anaerohalosphaeraceae bacterium]|jgi:UDP-glucose 4-epimerase|nr:UDP-glucose 4-epimerase GalE [Anaerohalosphaeraceae bacterium]HRT51740.1 UDP-glucose 4-epimerase GalE [Anaerohalosphaeraceae bacterium]HRT87930.1 UDP-glucose 4-epimerase GalE [Anaerohalosphaeraceae bacterium]
MNVLVCGGAGYIGSNMTAVLAGAGHNPVVFDNLSKGHRAALPDVPFVLGDLADYDLLVKTLSDHAIDAVMHFAAFIEVGESVQHPLRYYQNNFCNTHTLLRAMARAGVEKFVFSSTAAVYGMPDTIPITEDVPKAPINPYGDSKWAVERLCHFLSRAGQLRYAALRYFNACGAGQNATLGEDHRPESHLIPLIIQAAMGKRDAVMIYGTDYPTPDGTCIRDYIHVEDLCQAHLLALDKLNAAHELVYNLGNGTGFSVRQVIDTVREVSGKDFKVIETARRPGDPPVLTADAAKARTELGWTPRFGNLKTIVRTAWTWHSNYPDGYPE